MKNLLQNKYILVVLTLLVGGMIGWMAKPSTATDEEQAEHAHTVDENGGYTCSMHPQIRQNEPGSCPICGMALIPVEEDDGSENPLAIKMSANAMQLANVSTQHVGMGTPTKMIRLNGKVQADERLMFTQSSHIPGRVESLAVNFTGEYVRKGQVIATIYSPKLVTAQQELFETQKIRETQPELFKAARKKLLNWKISEDQIDQILENGSPIETLSIRAEQSGYVNNKLVNFGDYIKQGAPIYKISNLSKVWVLFDAYESDMQWIKMKDEVEFTISSLPGTSFSGVIANIDPVIDPKTRVSKIRVELKNTDNILKPEMFATGTLKANISQQIEITVPKSAVMWTGTRSVVYIRSQTDQGVSFLMREVTLGTALGDQYIVKEGLQPGEEIAVSGTFSIDAAAQLAGKPSMMSPEGGAPMTGHNHARLPDGQSGMQMNDGEKMETDVQHPEVNISTEKFVSSATFKEQLKNVFLAYLPLKDALIETDATMAKDKAEPLLDAINQVDMTEVKGAAHIEWMKDLAVLKQTVEYIKKEADVEKIRGALSPLSDQLYQTILKYDVETGGFRQYCPMAFNNTGAFWLSNSDSVLNPYFGDVMLTCGNVEEELN